MNLKSKQQIYDYVGEFLLKQGRKSVSTGRLPKCLYRGPDNTKCAIGCLIPDKLYKPELEMNTLNSLFKKKYKLPWYFRRYKDFLTQLQNSHDNDLSNYGIFIKRFIEIGNYHKLNTSKFENVNKKSFSDWQ
jgi:hypothetical protein